MLPEGVLKLPLAAVRVGAALLAVPDISGWADLKLYRA